MSSDAVYRRRLDAEMTRFRDVLGEHPRFNDVVTHQIREIFQGFVQTRQGYLEQARVRPVEFPPEICLQEERKLHENVLERFANTLVDRLSGIPLDEEALLGSDGFTYDPKVLTLWFLSGKSKEKSPICPENPVVFVVAPHLVARRAVHWMNGYQVPGYQHEKRRLIESSYEELRNRPDVHLPELPTQERVERRDRLRRMRESTVRIQIEAQRTFAVHAQAHEADQIRRLRADEERLAGEFAERMRVHEGARDGIQRDSMRQLAELRQEMESVHQGHLARIEELDGAVNTLHEQCDQIEEGIGALNQNLEVAHEENRRIQRALEETRFMTTHRDNSHRGFWGVVAQIGISALGSACLSGMGVQIGPMPGGFATRFTIPF